MITINYISVKNDINGVSSKDCQALIDLLFDRKDECNDCVLSTKLKSHHL